MDCVRRSVPQQNILIQFIIEAVMLSAAGGLLGTALGVSGVLLVGGNAFGISPIAGRRCLCLRHLLFFVVPARRAQLDPIVALRSIR